MMKTMRWPGAAVTLAGALVLAGCATGSDEGGDAMDATPEESSMAMESHDATDDAMDESTEPEVSDDAMADDEDDAEVPAAFDFTAPTVSGDETFDGSTIANTDVILWFWAPWCPTCVAESEEIVAALPDLPDGVEMIGVAGLSGDQSFMQEFVDMTGTGGFTHIADLDGSVWQGFGISTQATIVVIDDSGEAYTLGAGTTAEDLVDYAEKIAAA